MTNSTKSRNSKENILSILRGCITRVDLIGIIAALFLLAQLAFPLFSNIREALGHIGSSATWAHGMHGDDCGPNNQEPDADDILEGTTLHKIIGAERIAQERMPFCDHCKRSNQATSRSTHPDGVNILMMDGAVHFISDAIDDSVWHVMHSRETPADIIQTDFLLSFNQEDQSNQPTNVAVRFTGASADNQAVEKTFANSIEMHFTRIPAGKFMMGLPDKGNHAPYPLEAIPHKVHITSPFYIGTYEVTQQQYQEIMDENPSPNFFG